MKIPQKPPDLKNFLSEIIQDIQGKSLKPKESLELEEFITKCEQRYIHWDELRYKKIPNNLEPKFIWAFIKFLREPRFMKFKLGKTEFKYLLTNEIQKQLYIMDKYFMGNIETNLNLNIPEYKEKYAINSLMEEAIASSQLEGASTTRKLAKEILRKKKKPSNYSEQMIVNGYNVIQKIAKMTDKKITPQDILNLQKDITHDTLKNKDYAGKFRDDNSVVVVDTRDNKIIYKPPDYREIPKLMEEFCKFASDDSGEFIHPIVKGIFLHFLIGFIHPFNDGNGRTARTIFYWYVLTRGYWLFKFMPISRILLRSKVKYALSYLYTETDENDLTYFLKYNLSAIYEALLETEEYIKRKQKEQIKVMNLIKDTENINLRQADILRKFMKNPDKLFVINEIMTTYNIAYETARTDLLHLTKLGYIEKKQVGKKFVFRLSEKYKEKSI